MDEYIIKLENFSLRLGLEIFESDIKYPSNTNMTVFVESGGFSGRAQMEIDIKEFAQFASKLRSLYDTLSGSAEIKEPYGYRMFISFTAERGYVTVKGFLCDDLRQNELHFENSFEANYLKSFACELNYAYSKYLKG